jgi:hypothetical protein
MGSRFFAPVLGCWASNGAENAIKSVKGKSDGSTLFCFSYLRNYELKASILNYLIKTEDNRKEEVPDIPTNGGT